MILLRPLSMLAAWLPLALFAEGAPAASPIFDQEGEGQKMAERLRLLAPAEGSEERGMIRVTEKTGLGKPRQIPFTFRNRVTATSWTAEYRAGLGQEEEVLTIVHKADRPNSYQRTVAGKTTRPALTEPFAGSDFWVQDLGLEFLHWPKQRALRAEMIRSRPCRVLESTNPQPTGEDYARVLSWIDNESGGVLQAEAYDSAGKLLKKFSVGKVEKVQGRWQLRDLRMRNARTGQSTELRFQLEGEPAQ